MNKIVLPFIAMLGFLFAGCGPTAPKYIAQTPQSYTYSYSGTVAHPFEWSETEKGEDGTMHLLYSSQGQPEIYIYRLPDDAMETIGAIVREARLWKLQSSYRPDFEILDGYGWHVSIFYEDGYVASGGSNAWPSGDLWKGINDINTYLKGIIEAAGEEGIIGTTTHFDRR